MSISSELLDCLACPQCKGDIALNEVDKVLVCNNCSLLYPILDGIPIMLIDKAKRIALEADD